MHSRLLSRIFNGIAYFRLFWRSPCGKSNTPDVSAGDLDSLRTSYTLSLPISHHSLLLFVLTYLDHLALRIELGLHGVIYGMTSTAAQLYSVLGLVRLSESD